MKLKTNYFKFFKQDIKQVRWLFACISLVMFLFYPIQALMTINIGKERDTMEAVATWFNELFVSHESLLTNRGVVGLCIAVIIGAIVGVHAFSFCHDKKQVDFIFSLPVKRDKIFVSKLLTSMLIFLIPTMIGALMYLAVGALQGVLSYKAIPYLFGYVGLSFTFYCLGYFIALLAMSITGKLFVGILGTMVLLVYMPIFVFVFSQYVERFIYTFYGYSLSLMNHLFNMSPFVWANLLNKGNWIHVVVPIITAIILGFVSKLLFRIRPAERAGTSIIYVKLGEVIKCAIVLPIALAVGTIFYDLASQMQLQWMVFGVFLGALVCYALIEMIYGREFVKLFQGKKQLLTLGVLLIGFLSFFHLDVLQYNSYLPEKEDIKNAIIYIPEVQSGGYKEVDEIENLEMRINEEHYQLLEKVLAEAKDHQQSDTRKQYIRTVNIGVVYELNNGKEKRRSYEVPLNKIRDDLKILWENDTFLDICYEIRTDDLEKLKTDSISSDVEILQRLTVDQREEMLRIIQQEMQTIDGTRLTEENPLFQVYYTILEEEEKEAYRGVYVYPSFEKTLAYLKENGADVEKFYSGKEITSIKINTYNEDGTEQKSTMYTTDADIAYWLERMVSNSSVTIFQDLKENQDGLVQWNSGREEFFVMLQE